MTKNKNLFKNISLLFCLVPMLLLSLFCLVPKRKDMLVSADYVATDNFVFYGSNFVTYATCSSTAGVFDGHNFISSALTISLVDGSYFINVKGSFKVTSSAGSRSLDYTYDIPESSYNNPFQTNFVWNVPFSDLPGYGVYMGFFRYGNLSSSINRVVFVSTQGPSGGWDYNWVIYYDSNDNFVSFFYQISHLSDYLNYRPYGFTNRTYYINLGYLTDNSYYQAGYTDGYNQGTADGSNSGYSDGYSAGESVGYGNGYNDGIIAGGNYSFNSLIGAVIDAPVSAFTSLLNFELFGVNILGLITGLLSLAVIVLIIKLCMGGR